MAKNSWRYPDFQPNQYKLEPTSSNDMSKGIELEIVLAEQGIVLTLTFSVLSKLVTSLNQVDMANVLVTSPGMILSPHSKWMGSGTTAAHPQRVLGQNWGGANI